MKKLLYVKGTDGLGNRMLSLEYACRMAASLGIDIFVDWKDTCYSVDNEVFSEYFEVRDVALNSAFSFESFVSPYPSNPEIFSAKDIEKFIRRPSNFSWIPSGLAFWRRVHRLENRYVYRKNPIKSIASGEHIRPLFKKHDLVLFLCSLPYRVDFPDLGQFKTRRIN